MSGAQLKPCPFCGGEAEFSKGKTGNGNDWHYIECASCEAMGPNVAYADHNIAVKEAIAEAWNRRDADPAQIRADALQDAPERIWTAGGHYWPDPTFKRDKTHYTRTDLCITEAECQRRIDAAIDDLMKALRAADTYIDIGHFQMARNITRNAIRARGQK